jgi:hypothetical protein
MNVMIVLHVIHRIYANTYVMHTHAYIYTYLHVSICSQDVPHQYEMHAWPWPHPKTTQLIASKDWKNTGTLQTLLTS